MPASWSQSLLAWGPACDSPSSLTRAVIELDRIERKENMLKSFQIVLTATQGEPGAKELGNRWKDGMARVELFPNDPPVKGRWRSLPPGDITSKANPPKGISRIYEFITARKALYLREIPKKIEEPVATLLSLDKFDINNPMSTEGTGQFSIERKEFAVDWYVDVTQEVKYEKPAKPPATKPLRRLRYRLEPNDAALVKKTKQGFQEYEYFDDKNVCLYVGRSGGEDGQQPNSWVDRLDDDHLNSEWIQGATTVHVLFGLTLAEAMAQEEFRITGGNGLFNKQSGDFSIKFPQGDLVDNARAAEKHGSRERFRLIILPE